MANQKSRGWCFTINNPGSFDEIDEECIRNFNAFQYMIIGNEKGEEGTPHHQGYVHFKHPVSFNYMKTALPRAHIELRKGSPQQAIEYCKKDEDFTEWGVSPSNKKEAQKQMWHDIITFAEMGRVDVIKDLYPAMYIRYYSRLMAMVKIPRIILEHLDNEWWYGETGTGKSRRLWQEYPDHYTKELNKWWCGYAGEEVVAIEEWCPKNECTASQLKIWADRYPFTAQIKGGSIMNIRPKKIIVLSNYTIDDCFTNAEDRDPIKRRFKVTRFFNLDNMFKRVENESSDIVRLEV